jgi:hypothetical protein
MWVTPGASIACLQLELRLGIAQVVEQPCPGSEKHGDDGDQHLVEQTGREILLYDVRATPDRNIPSAGFGPGLLERRFDAVGDEVEGCSALLPSGSRGWRVSTKTGWW